MALKRYRKVAAKSGQLTARYGSDGEGSIDLMYAHGGGGACRPDARMLAGMFEDKRFRPSMKNFPGFDQEMSLREELEARGYDITTLRFSIQKKA